MRTAKRQRSKPQHDLFFNDPLYSWRGVSTTVGQFFEHLTAQLFHGYRVQADEELAYNCDVETICGRQIESKASRRAYWLIRLEQLAVMETYPGAYYVLWRYAKDGTVGLHKKYETKGDLYQFLAANILSCWVVSPSYIRALLYGRPLQWAEDDTVQRVTEADLKAAIAGPLSGKTKVKRRRLKYLKWRVYLKTLIVDNGVLPVEIPF